MKLIKLKCPCEPIAGDVQTRSRLWKRELLRQANLCERLRMMRWMPFGQVSRQQVAEAQEAAAGIELLVEGYEVLIKKADP